MIYFYLKVSFSTPCFQIDFKILICSIFQLFYTSETNYFFIGFEIGLFKATVVLNFFFIFRPHSKKRKKETKHQCPLISCENALISSKTKIWRTPFMFLTRPVDTKVENHCFIAPQGLNKELSEKLRNPGWKTLPQAVSDRLRVAGFQEVTHTFFGMSTTERSP